MTDGELIESINNSIQKMYEQQVEITEKCIAQACIENDFVVGSIDSKIQLESILPNGTTIVYSPYVDPKLILMVKKIAWRI